MKKKPIQARLDYIKGRFIGKLLLGEFTGPKDRSKGSRHGGRGEPVQREKKEGETKMLGLYRMSEKIKWLKGKI